MIKVKIELHTTREYKTIGIIHIINNLTGSLKNGNYDIKYLADEKSNEWKECKVENHKRKLNVYHLLSKVIQKIISKNH